MLLPLLPVIVSARLLPMTFSNWLTLKLRGVPLMSSTPLAPLMLIKPLVRLAVVLVAGAMAPLRSTVSPSRLLPMILSMPIKVSVPKAVPLLRTPWALRVTAAPIRL